MSEPRTDRCETCRFWEQTDPPDGGEGYCRRYPPVLEEPAGPDREDGFYWWPTVSWEDWCGEWQAIPLDAPATPE